MKKKLVLHIGTHKTGSTSLQRFLLDHAGYLSRQGIGLYRGMFKEVNHTELVLAAIRYERDTFQKQNRSKHFTFDAGYTQQVAQSVQAYIASRPEPRIIFTSEGLCWLRHDDEIHRLQRILDTARNEVTVVLYLRNKTDFLRSYTNQVLKYGRKLSSDSESVFHVEPGTWLTDYDSLIDVYKRGFGARNVVIIDYDNEMRKIGNIIPSFLAVLGLDRALAFDLPSVSYFLNTSNPADEIEPLPGRKRWIRRAMHAWHRWLQKPAA